LGIGTGESLNETPATGMQWPEQKERTARFREALHLIKQLWYEERVSFEGDYYQTRNATIYNRPEEPVPIYIAAAGPVIVGARPPETLVKERWSLLDRLETAADAIWMLRAPAPEPPLQPRLF
jgi:hypothetical protein